MFWDVIDSTNAAGPYPDQETWRCRMTAALEKHTMEEILDWQLILEEYMQSACRQDILAAAAARGVPCLGDGFSQFRAWLIAGGEEVYRNVLEEPDCLADLPGNGDAFQFKGLTLAVYYAYEVQLFRNCPEELRDLYSDLRGRTLDDSFIILDEAQNTSREQMKMFLTRLGFGSKIVITGDVTQIDLPDGKASGLKEAMRVLRDVEGIGICELTNADVVRHVMVQRIVEAYERYETAKNGGKGRK